MKARATILVDNSVTAPGPLLGEHGFSALVERGEARVLFDTGQGEALLPNARALGVELADVPLVALSHGHYDHTGGLLALLRAFGPRRVAAHPGVFAPRRWQKGDGTGHPIGLPFPRQELEAAGARFSLSPGWSEPAPGLHLTGEVPRLTSFETGDPSLVAEATGAPDTHPDDLSLVAEGEQGLLVLLGCAHAGIVNILRHVQARFPGRPLHTVIGGTHLGFADEVRVAATLEALRPLGVARLGASHCTGPAAACRLHAALGDRFLFAGVGTVVEV